MPIKVLRGTEPLIDQMNTDAETTVIIPLTKRRECPQCRGAGWVWLVDKRTLQKEIGDCPGCGAKRPELPQNSHRTGRRHREAKYA